MKHILLLILSFILISGTPLFAQQDQSTPVYEVVISPNPVEDRVSIKVSQGHLNLTEIKIYDVIGKEVFSINISSGNGVYPVDLSVLRPGVYFCSILSDRGVVETRKLVKTNK